MFLDRKDFVMQERLQITDYSTADYSTYWMFFVGEGKDELGGVLCCTSITRGGERYNMIFWQTKTGITFYFCDNAVLIDRSTKALSHSPLFFCKEEPELDRYR